MFSFVRHFCGIAEWKKKEKKKEKKKGKLQILLLSVDWGGRDGSLFYKNAWKTPMEEWHF